MRKIAPLLLAVLFFSVFLASSARAQFSTPPAPLPRWGDYDDSHTWRDASWWWENKPEWVRAHHPCMTLLVKRDTKRKTDVIQGRKGRGSARLSASV